MEVTKMSIDMESHRESVDRAGSPDSLSRYQSRLSGYPDPDRYQVLGLSYYDEVLHF